jgi:hypothetical protein
MANLGGELPQPLRLDPWVRLQLLTDPMLERIDPSTHRPDSTDLTLSGSLFNRGRWDSFQPAPPRLRGEILTVSSELQWPQTGRFSWPAANLLPQKHSLVQSAPTGGHMYV